MRSPCSAKKASKRFRKAPPSASAGIGTGYDSWPLVAYCDVRPLRVVLLLPAHEHLDGRPDGGRTLQLQVHEPVLAGRGPGQVHGEGLEEAPEGSWHAGARVDAEGLASLPSTQTFQGAGLQLDGGPQHFSKPRPAEHLLGLARAL